MNIQEFLFYVFAALTVLSSLLVVVNRNPVNGAMSMIVAFLSTAALFVLLNAFYLAVLQVIVYAGAVMVLFVFIIMLLNVEAASHVRRRLLPSIAAVLALALLVIGISTIFLDSPELAAVEAQDVPAVSAGEGKGDLLGYSSAARAYGLGLFTKYMLPFQVTGFLLLIAMIGVIVLSRRQPDGDETDANGGGTL